MLVDPMAILHALSPHSLRQQPTTWFRHIPEVHEEGEAGNALARMLPSAFQFNPDIPHVLRKCKAKSRRSSRCITQFSPCRIYLLPHRYLLEEPWLLAGFGTLQHKV